MKITFWKWEDEEGLNHTLDVNNFERIVVAPLNQVPEDAVIDRRLIGCDQILALMKEAWEAGKNNELFEVTVKEVDPLTEFESSSCP